MTAKLSITSRAVAIVLAASLTRCATGYGEFGLTGGYRDKMIEPDIAWVIVGGNGYTAPDKVQAIATLRAAELTLQQGYRRFSMFTSVDQAAVDARNAGHLPAYLREKAAHEDGGAPRPIEKDSTYYTNGFVTSVRKSSTGVYVVMSKDTARGAYDAAKVFAELRPQLAPTASETPVTPPDPRQ